MRRMMTISGAASVLLLGGCIIDTDGDGFCHAPLDCDDDDACTLDGCEDDRCAYRPARDGTPCDDGDACTGADTCARGVCRGTPIVPCCADILCADDLLPADSDGDGCSDLCTAPCEVTCDCYAVARDFPDECPLMCPSCGNYWLCEGALCMPRCGPMPAEVAACLAHTCDDELACAATDYCQREGCAGPGVCAARPTECLAMWMPVCGCDGHTYGNVCAAASAGVGVDYQGECGARCGGFIGLLCADGEYCELPAGMCLWADETGTCRDRPLGCPDNVDPVCGCDGVTYFNDCERQVAAAQRAHDGACDGTVGPRR